MQQFASAQNLIQPDPNLNQPEPNLNQPDHLNQQIQQQLLEGSPAAEMKKQSTNFMPVVTDGVSAHGMGEDLLSDSDNKNSDDSLHTKIKRLTDKKKNGLKLTDDEIHELARLNRVKASRKYRQKEKIEKQQRSKQQVNIEDKDEEIDTLKKSIKSLQQQVIDAKDREKQYVTRENQAFMRERESRAREKQQRLLIFYLKRKVQSRRNGKAQKKKQDKEKKAEERKEEEKKD